MILLVQQSSSCFNVIPRMCCSISVSTEDLEVCHSLHGILEESQWPSSPVPSLNPALGKQRSESRDRQIDVPATPMLPLPTFATVTKKLLTVAGAYGQKEDAASSSCTRSFDREVKVTESSVWMVRSGFESCLRAWASSGHVNPRSAPRY